MVATGQHTLTPAFQAVVYSTPIEAFNATFPFLLRNEIDSHPILSHLLERISPASISTTASPHFQLPPPEVWIAVWTYTPEPILDILFSITNNNLRPNPAFITSYTPLTTSNLTERINALVDRLLNTAIPVGRIYSVFGPTSLVQNFVEAWFKQTHQPLISPPYLAASNQVCTLQTLKLHLGASPVQGCRLATARDLDAVADLCLEYSQWNDPFILTSEQAREEAQQLISSRRLYVYEIPSPSTRPCITSIVVVGRVSERVAAITKVCTLDEYRRRGYAKRLLAWVCRHMLHDHAKNYVTTLVTHGNPEMESVFGGVGFTSRRPAHPTADDWVEMGFDVIV